MLQFGHRENPQQVLTSFLNSSVQGSKNDSKSSTELTSSLDDFDNPFHPLSNLPKMSVLSRDGTCFQLPVGHHYSEAMQWCDWRGEVKYQSQEHGNNTNNILVPTHFDSRSLETYAEVFLQQVASPVKLPLKLDKVVGTFWGTPVTLQQMFNYFCVPLSVISESFDCFYEYLSRKEIHTLISDLEKQKATLGQQKAKVNSVVEKKTTPPCVKTSRKIRKARQDQEHDYDDLYDESSLRRARAHYNRQMRYAYMLEVEDFMSPYQSELNTLTSKMTELDNRKSELMKLLKGEDVCRVFYEKIFL